MPRDDCVTTFPSNPLTQPFYSSLRPPPPHPPNNSPTLLKYAEYAEEDIVGVARDVMAEKNEAQSDLRAVNKKYSSSRYGGVANTVLSSDI